MNNAVNTTERINAVTVNPAIIAVV